VPSHKTPLLGPTGIPIDIPIIGAGKEEKQDLPVIFLNKPDGGKVPIPLVAVGILSEGAVQQIIQAVKAAQETPDAEDASFKETTDEA
jgi:hypothetical protein